MTSRLIVWLTLQLLATGIVVLRIPLAAQYPEPAEKLALHVVLSLQIVGVSLLFPFLFTGIRSTVQILLTAVPFQLAAMFLAGRELREVAPALLYVDSWIVTQAAVGSFCQSVRAQAIAVSIANCLTLGGGALRYLRLEFNPDVSKLAFEKITPLPSTVAALDHESIRASFVFLGAFAAFSTAALMIRARRSRGFRYATSYPPSSPHPAAR